jgi:hypothetical protein
LTGSNLITQRGYTCPLSNTGVTTILTGTANWNVASLKAGMYDIGDGVPPIQIKDPANNTWIGSWTNGAVKATQSGHLSHAHVARSQ